MYKVWYFPERGGLKMEDVDVPSKEEAIKTIKGLNPNCIVRACYEIEEKKTETGTESVRKRERKKDYERD